MRIAFLSSLDPRDKKSWSGSFYYMSKAITENIGEVVFLGPVTGNYYGLIQKILNLFVKIFRIVGLNKYNKYHSVLLSFFFSKYFEAKLRNLDVDIVFAPAASTEIALLNIKAPLIYLSDTTFQQIYNYYPSFSNFSKISFLESNFIEQLAIRKADVLLFSSDWAASFAKQNYKADAKNTYVIPFGANIEQPPPISKIEQRYINLKKKCVLFFPAIEWERKGGEIVISAFYELLNLEQNTELIVCGCKLPQKYYHEKIRNITYLDKNSTKENNMFQDLLIESHFLFLPTRADCTPLIFCEAGAFGLPVVTTDTGGVSSLVKNGENGFVLPMNASGKEYADLIFKCFRMEDDYKELVNKSRTYFHKYYNWNQWSLTLANIIDQKYPDISDKT